jgi:hypothetical protein
MANTLRITFELELADNPPLYEDLAQFPKGPRRASRLRTLAHAGLIAQLTMRPLSPAIPSTLLSPQEVCMQEASLELFGPASHE